MYYYGDNGHGMLVKYHSSGSGIIELKEKANGYEQTSLGSLIFCNNGVFHGKTGAEIEVTPKLKKIQDVYKSNPWKSA